MKLQEFFNTGDLEFGPEAIAADKQLATNIQEVFVWLKFLDPPADGKFGPISTAALIEFQEVMSPKISGIKEEKGFLGKITAKALIETSPNEVPARAIDNINLSNDDIAAKIIKYMQAKRYQIATGKQNYNIVYVEGMSENLTLNDDTRNQFNDVRMVIEIPNGKPIILGKWEGTTEPGTHYTMNPMNPQGAARIAFGQYKSWRVDQHCGASGANCHEALVQVDNVSVFRDKNKDFIRTGDKLFTGLFGINQHWGYDLPRNDIGLAGAGCLVGRTTAGHKEFMKLIKQDKRYQSNNSYKFFTTIIPGNEL